MVKKKYDFERVQTVNKDGSYSKKRGRKPKLIKKGKPLSKNNPVRKLIMWLLGAAIIAVLILDYLE